MKKLIILFLLVGCGVQHNHKGIPEIPDQVNIEVIHKIDFDGIESFCELQTVEIQACIDNLTQIFIHILNNNTGSEVL